MRSSAMAEMNFLLFWLTRRVMMPVVSCIEPRLIFTSGIVLGTWMISRLRSALEFQNGATEKLSMKFSMLQTAKCTPRKRRRVKRRFQATTIPHAERFFRTTGKIWCVLECTLTAFIDAPCIGIGQDPLILGWLDLDVWMAHRWATSGTSVLFTSQVPAFSFVHEQFWGRAARASNDSQESGRLLIFASSC